MKWLIPISLAALGGTARADQCAWIDGDVARRAHAILATSPKVIAFCEPCGDTVPGVPEVASTVELRNPSHDFAELYLNGARTSIDLAYTFVQTSPSEYKNLALLAGCPATGVSPSLEVAAETKSGVLITAGDKPVTPPAAMPVVLPAAAPVPAVAPAPPAPPQVYVHSTTRYELAWPALALAAGIGAGIGSLMTLLLASTRRRRDMRPRASELR